MQLVRRSVAMLLACLPRDDAFEELRLFGQSDAAPALPQSRVVVSDRDGSARRPADADWDGLAQEPETLQCLCSSCRRGPCLEKLC